MLPDMSKIWNFWLTLVHNFYQHICAWLTLFGRLMLDTIYLLGHPRAIPIKEISLTIYKAGVSALGITALVGMLVGVSMSYLSSLQLQRFGAEIYIIDLLGLSIIRELGPMLAAIIIAGRSGSAMTAEIGIMRVTQELDALSALGISHSLRLVLPKVVALSLVMPLLIVWTDVIALIGGMVSAQLALDIGYQQFLEQLPKSVPVINVYIGLAKGVMFGMMIAMIASHFGFLIKPNTESLGRETTNAVVASITAVIMVDTIFSIVFRNVGFP
jgi:phospholipid/cholesterol/gamma-HCH transport system permease protein